MLLLWKAKRLEKVESTLLFSVVFVLTILTVIDVRGVSAKPLPLPERVEFSNVNGTVTMYCREVSCSGQNPSPSNFSSSSNSSSSSSSRLQRGRGAIFSSTLTVVLAVCFISSILV
ncbi:hypothetical protein IE53DRAFT_367983 [Violaceomyces palustris]|uniref:Uncharacterized protein n=1 Tax=Violaceomyces palustris TaxID=1673888 RepID=A0ACD0P0J2_9BASI|nr:hypothetical protein IE53DRAFT_367983 [Violaceomyces palustris]